MFKISKILTALVESQNNINKNLLEINKNMQETVAPKFRESWKELTITANRLSEFETNIYTKEQTVETINKEYDYRKDYEKCKESNSALLEMIEQYFKYKDKYEVIELFKQIDSEYIVDRQINNK